MTTSALLLVLGASLIHASWNLFTKRARAPVAFLCLGLTFGGALALIPLAILVGQRPVPPGGWTYVIVTGTLHAIYYMFLAFAYQSGGDLSLVYPVARGTAPLLVLIAAIFLFNEWPSMLGLAGIVSVVAGLFVINLKELSFKSLAALFRAVAGGPLLLALCTGIATASYSLVDRQALQNPQMDPWIYLLLCYVLCVLFLAPFTYYQNRGQVRARVRSSFWPMLGVGTMSPLAYGLILVAFTTASKVSYIVSARECSIVFATLLGALVLKEEQLRRRLSGAILIAGGVALLAVAG